MGIPIISQVLNLVDSAVDKVFPDATAKERAKTEIKMAMMQQAMESEKLLFGDTENARKAYEKELEAANVPSWARALQVTARPFTTYAMVLMYVYVKVSPILPFINAPTLDLNSNDYYLIGAVFCFLFGARSLEKLKGKS